MQGQDQKPIQEQQRHQSSGPQFRQTSLQYQQQQSNLQPSFNVQNVNQKRINMHPPPAPTVPVNNSNNEDCNTDQQSATLPSAIPLNPISSLLASVGNPNVIMPPPPLKKEFPVLEEHLPSSNSNTKSGSNKINTNYKSKQHSKEIFIDMPHRVSSSGLASSPRQPEIQAPGNSYLQQQPQPSMPMYMAASGPIMEIQKPRFTSEQDELIMQSKKQGKSWEEIAAEVGCDCTKTVIERYNYLKHNGGSSSNDDIITSGTIHNSNSSITDLLPPLPPPDTMRWDDDDITMLQELLELGERAKWKYISGRLTKELNKIITAFECEKKFKYMFGVAEASSALGSSLSYVLSPNGWSSLENDSQHQQLQWQEINRRSNYEPQRDGEERDIAAAAAAAAAVAVASGTQYIQLQQHSTVNPVTVVSSSSASVFGSQEPKKQEVASQGHPTSASNGSLAKSTGQKMSEGGINSIMNW